VSRVDNDKDSDPVWALPKMMSETIIQIEFSSATDPFHVVNEVNDFFSEMAPEHEGAVVDLWELMENLREAKITARKEQTVRIRMQASFNFMDFFTVEVEASRIKRQYDELMSPAGGNGRITLVTKNPFEMVAWIPLVSPEESLEGIKATIGSMRNCMAQEDIRMSLTGLRILRVKSRLEWCRLRHLLKWLPT
jgi:hypothetical protein